MIIAIGNSHIQVEDLGHYVGPNNLSIFCQLS